MVDDELLMHLRVVHSLNLINKPDNEHKWVRDI